MSLGDDKAARRANSATLPWLLGGIAGLWLLLLIVGLLSRPLLAVDETRYLSVAWEMYRGGHWLVPHLNGETYSHKPPLLFWLIALLWHAGGGPHEWLARLVAPSFGLLSLALTALAARRLWPHLPQTIWLAPLLLATALLWSLFSTLSMFDCLVAFFTLLGLHAAIDLGQGLRARGILLLGLAVGGGVLAKGPVILVYLLPMLALSGRRFGGGRLLGWSGDVLAGIILGAAIALAWAVPAALSGGPAYGREIFLGQSSGRLFESFAHRRPIWWYLPLLPLLLFPWSVWPPLWRGWRALWAQDANVRLCLLWSLSGLVIFSLISGKQAHYLLPLFPALALAAARLLLSDAGAGPRWIDALPCWLLAALGLALLGAPAFVTGRFDLPPWAFQAAPVLGIALLASAALLLGFAARPRGNGAIAAIAACSLSLMLAAHLGGFPFAAANYELGPASRWVAALQEAGRPVAFLGNYQGQFHYLGRLERPLTRLSPAGLGAWAEANPTGVVVALRSAEATEAGALEAAPHRGRMLVFRAATDFVADRQLWRPR